MDESAAPITCLAALSSATFGSEMTSNENRQIDMLLAGDASGGLRLWQLQNSTSTGELEVTERSFHQLTVSSSRQSCSIVSLQVLRGGGVGVATTDIPNNSQIIPGATSIALPMARAVHILDLSEGKVKAALNGHANDSVICMCELPDGALVTGGGKMDATLQLWNKETLQGNQEDSEGIVIREQSDLTLSDVGYVFALASMPDSKEGSSLYALAAARYNTVKIIL
jgi:WD40 repeat protein